MKRFDTKSNTKLTPRFIINRENAIKSRGCRTPRNDENLMPGSSSSRTPNSTIKRNLVKTRYGEKVIPLTPTSRPNRQLKTFGQSTTMTPSRCGTTVHIEMNDILMTPGNETETHSMTLSHNSNLRLQSDIANSKSSPLFLNRSKSAGNISRKKSMSLKLRRSTSEVKIGKNLFPEEFGENDGEVSRITVGVRIRPLQPREFGNALTVEGREVKIASDLGSSHSFSFDYAFASSEEDSQQQLFDAMVKPLLENVFLGYNACLFAYGQTGSGKTHSMMGPDIEVEDIIPTSGIIPRFCHELMDRAQKLTSKDEGTHASTSVEISYLEVYNEKIYDLLVSGVSVPLRVREHPVYGPYVANLSKHSVNSFADVKQWLTEGNKKRVVATTEMNDKSSRSHSLFMVVVTQSTIQSDGKGSWGPEHVRRSQINLVDLAGSERISHSIATSDRIREGVSINRSLLTLGKVISALVDKRTFVPYRESVLTWLLKESLGGNSRTSMLATVSPCSSHLEETLATLRYASQARSIVNTVRVNESPQDKLISELRAEIDKLKAMTVDHGVTEGNDEDFAALKSELKSITEIVDDLKKELSESKKHEENIRMEAEKITNEAKRKEEEAISDLEILRKNMDTEINKAKEREMDALDELEELRMEAVSAREKQKEAIDELAAMRSRIEKNAEDARAGNDSVLEELNECRNQVKRLEEERENWRIRTNSIEVEVENWKKHVDNFKKELNDCTKKAEIAEGELLMSKKQLETLETGNKSLSDQLADMKAKYDSTCRNLKSKESELILLKDSLMDKDLQIVQLKEELHMECKGKPKLESIKCGIELEEDNAAFFSIKNDVLVTKEKLEKEEYEIKRLENAIRTKTRDDDKVFEEISNQQLEELTSLKKQMTDIENELSVKTKINEQLEHDLEQANLNCRALERTVDELKKLDDSLVTENILLTASVQTSITGGDQMDLPSISFELKPDYTTIKEELVKLRKKLAEKVSKLAAIRKKAEKVFPLEEELKKEKEVRLNLEGSLKKQIEESRAEQERLIREMESMKSELDLLKELEKKYKDKIEESVHDTNEEERKGWEKEAEEYKEKISKLESLVLELTQKLEISQTRVESLSEELELARDKNDILKYWKAREEELNRELLKVEQEKGELKQKLDDSLIHVDSLTEKLSSSNAMKRKFTELKLEEMETEVKKIDQEKAELKGKLLASETCVDNLKEELKSVQSQLKKESTDLESKIASLQNQNEHLEQTVLENKFRVEQKTNLILQLEQLNSKHKEELAQAKELIEDLRMKTNQVEHRAAMAETPTKPDWLSESDTSLSKSNENLIKLKDLEVKVNSLEDALKIKESRNSELHRELIQAEKLLQEQTAVKLDAVKILQEWKLKEKEELNERNQSMADYSRCKTELSLLKDQIGRKKKRIEVLRDRIDRLEELVISTMREANDKKIHSALKESHAKVFDCMMEHSYMFHWEYLLRKARTLAHKYHIPYEFDKVDNSVAVVKHLTLNAKSFWFRIDFKMWFEKIEKESKWTRDMDKDILWEVEFGKYYEVKSDSTSSCPVDSDNICGDVELCCKPEFICGNIWKRTVVQRHLSGMKDDCSCLSIYFRNSDKTEVKDLLTVINNMISELESALKTDPASKRPI